MTPRHTRASPTTEDLVAEGASLAFRYGQGEPERTALLRRLAVILVELRSRNATEDGNTDWAGRSGPYREAVARIYEQSRLDPDERATMQAALRYHVGNVLREVAPEDELAELGMMAKRPVDRVKATRERLAALARAGAVAQNGTTADPVRQVLAARVLLENIAADPAALDGQTDKRREVTKAVAAIEELASSLGDYLEATT